MGKTIADVIREEGMAEGLRRGELRTKRQALLRLLRNRFKSVPRPITGLIQATEDLGQLDTWFDLASTAEKLADIRFDPAG